MDRGLRIAGRIDLADQIIKLQLNAQVDEPIQSCAPMPAVSLGRGRDVAAKSPPLMKVIDDEGSRPDDHSKRRFSHRWRQLSWDYHGRCYT